MAIDMSADTGGLPTAVVIPRQPEMDASLALTWCCFVQMTSKPLGFHYAMATTELGAAGGIGLGVRNDGLFAKPHFDSWSGSGFSEVSDFFGNRLFNTGWHHLCATKKAGASGSNVTADLFIDGEPIGLPIEQTLLFTDSSLDLFLGKAETRTWPGGLADCRWYTKELSQEAIETIATGRGRDGVIDNLLVRYPLDELTPGDLVPMAAGSIRDVGPYGFHGQGVNIASSEYVKSPIASSRSFSVSAPQRAV